MHGKNDGDALHLRTKRIKRNGYKQSRRQWCSTGDSEPNVVLHLVTSAITSVAHYHVFVTNRKLRKRSHQNEGAECLGNDGISRFHQASSRVFTLCARSVSAARTSLPVGSA